MAWQIMERVGYSLDIMEPRDPLKHICKSSNLVEFGNLCTHFSALVIDESMDS